MPDKPLEFSYDEARDILTIEGIKYSGQIFRTFGFGPLNTLFALTDRADGVISLSFLARKFSKNNSVLAAASSAVETNEGACP